MLYIKKDSASKQSRVFILLLILMWMGNSYGKMNAAQKAQAIFQQTGVSSGLAVHLAPNDAQLSMALTNAQRMTVHALALDNQQLQQTRSFFLKTGYYGLASAEIPCDGLNFLMLRKQPILFTRKIWIR